MPEDGSTGKVTSGELKRAPKGYGVTYGKEEEVDEVSRATGERRAGHDREFVIQVHGWSVAEAESCQSDVTEIERIPASTRRARVRHEFGHS